MRAALCSTYSLFTGGGVAATCGAGALGGITKGGVGGEGVTGGIKGKLFDPLPGETACAWGNAKKDENKPISRARAMRLLIFLYIVLCYL